MKFFIAIVLALAFCGFTSAQPSGDYTPIQWDANNQTLISLLNFGVQGAVPQAITAKQLANENWGYTDVISVEVQMIVDDGTFFDFVVDIVDDSGDTACMDVVVFGLTPDYSAMSLDNWAIIQA